MKCCGLFRRNESGGYVLMNYTGNMAGSSETIKRDDRNAREGAHFMLS
jgi:hypothetical protein